MLMPVDFPSRCNSPVCSAQPQAAATVIGAQALNSRKPIGHWLAKLFVALACSAVLMLAGCSHTPPEEALRNTISQMQAAAEAKDTDALFDPIAEDFSASGGMDRQAFRRYVVLLGLRNSKIGVTTGPLDVKLLGDRATVAFTAALSGGPGWLPDQAQVYDVDTGWRLEGDDWKLISARWKPRL